MPGAADYNFEAAASVDRCIDGVSYLIAIVRRHGQARDGLAVFNLTRGSIVFDGVGSDNMALRMAVFEALKGATPSEFASICMTFAPARAATALQSKARPRAAHAITSSPLPDRDIRLRETREAAELAAGIHTSGHRFAFRHRTRAEILSWLLRHRVDRLSDGRCRLSWDAVIPAHDGSGTLEDFTPNPAFDNVWNTMLAEGRVVRQAWRETMDLFLSGSFTPAAGRHLGKFEFAILDGSLLCLEAIDGVRWCFSSVTEVREHFIGMADADLAKLYHLVGSVDEIMHPDALRDEMEYRLGSIRAGFEQEHQIVPGMGAPTP
ncbi:hypothetical protein [Acidiphilium sp. C61]|uniref:hypothetical protein n=1 Tax=Acidiphilium sp. C61 TaxID=1671485 RepID=UPI00157ABE65|nr:hypothetical protein [Acidiphilium sp. C61]